MKSVKARNFIKGRIRMGSSSFSQIDVENCVLFAEREAEKRMREKALSAFDDMWFENGEDGEFEPDYEYHRRNFMQKLNEE